MFHRRVNNYLLYTSRLAVVAVRCFLAFSHDFSRSGSQNQLFQEFVTIVTCVDRTITETNTPELTSELTTCYPGLQASSQAASFLRTFDLETNEGLPTNARQHRTGVAFVPNNIQFSV